MFGAERTFGAKDGTEEVVAEAAPVEEKKPTETKTAPVEEVKPAETEAAPAAEEKKTEIETPVQNKKSRKRKSKKK